jgi:hypothetical protein
MSDPSIIHFTHLTHILDYLKSNPTLKITYRGITHPRDFPVNTITGYGDSSHKDNWDLRSTLGGIIMLNGGPIFWFVKLSDTRSPGGTSESEYKSFFEIAREIKFERDVMSELGFKQINPTIIYEDNTGVIDFVNNNTSFSHLRHLDIKLLSAKDWVINGDIRLIAISSENNLADIFTKPLPIAKFHRILKDILSPQSYSYDSQIIDSTSSY